MPACIINSHVWLIGSTKIDHFPVATRRWYLMLCIDFEPMKTFCISYEGLFVWTISASNELEIFINNKICWEMYCISHFLLFSFLLLIIFNDFCTSICWSSIKTMWHQVSRTFKNTCLSNFSLSCFTFFWALFMSLQICSLASKKSG